ncbi:hypothetical protein NA56DRAFT_645667 [Hyaloscypha hepaticicola]|uniref:Uncharacterized protein n=1 Tax=Hyaloscypha hepaticicola TaxID=2082293 RepID=A0A2J6Q536_9HELO|nr:hypothetical protein NA56DRAFT_645667 [Hyaloscypha hepaticicola]
MEQDIIDLSALILLRFFSLLLRFARNRYPSVYNIRNYQRNIRNDFARNVKNNSAFLNPRPAGIARRTLVTGIHYFVTWDSVKRLDPEYPQTPHNR